MADFELERVAEEEAGRSDYVNGFMDLQEAYERGYVDEIGTEQGLEYAYSESFIPTMENVNNELRITELEFTNSMLSRDNTPERRQVKVGFTPLKTGKGIQVGLNPEATKNLANETPTCNVCREFMQPRAGKFGKFYFCRCDGQPTVSDKYWRNVKKEKSNE